MRLGKIEKEVLVTLLDETQCKNGRDGLYRQYLIKCVAKRCGKWDEGRVKNWSGGLHWGVRGLDGQNSFRSSLSRAFRQLERKELVEKCYFDRWLTDKGRLVARGIKISRAKIKQ